MAAGCAGLNQSLPASRTRSHLTPALRYVAKIPLTTCIYYVDAKPLAVRPRQANETLSSPAALQALGEALGLVAGLQRGLAAEMAGHEQLVSY